MQAIVALRRVRMTAAEIAELLAMALSTVSAILRRVGLGRLPRLAPPEPPNRYKRRQRGLAPARGRREVNAGPGQLDIVCIHASPVMIQENLEE